MTLFETIDETLKASNLKPDQFQEIVQRLFAYGIVVRDADTTEQRLYDDGLRMLPLLLDYFGASGFRLIHDDKNQYLRLYAPGAVVPGRPNPENEPVPSLRARFTPEFVAAALGLRFLFQQGLTEGGGRLADTGEVMIRFDELADVMSTHIKRPLPRTAVERDRLLRELKRHRLIHFGAQFNSADEDALLAILPTILGIIGEDALAAALEAGGQIEAAQEQDAGTEEGV